MYKYRIQLTDKHTHNTVIESSNRISRMFKYANQSHNVLFVIKNVETDKIIARGSK